MSLRNTERRLVAGIATGVLMIGAQSVLAADSGTVTGVVSDASGKPVAGAFVVISMENYLAEWGQWITVIQGVIFVACVMLFRRGVVGELAKILRVQL